MQFSYSVYRIRRMNEEIEPASVLETSAAFVVLCDVENASFAQTGLFALQITWNILDTTVCTKWTGHSSAILNVSLVAWIYL